MGGRSLIRELVFGRSGLLRGVVLGGRSLIRGVVFGGSGLIRGRLCLSVYILMWRNYFIILLPFLSLPPHRPATMPPFIYSTYRLLLFMLTNT